MTNKKLSDVLDNYELVLRDYMYSSEELDHLYTMIPKMRKFIEEERREKAMRWLGFMQGVFWSHGFFTLEQLKQHNKP